MTLQSKRAAALLLSAVLLACLTGCGAGEMDSGGPESAVSSSGASSAGGTTGGANVNEDALTDALLPETELTVGNVGAVYSDRDISGEYYDKVTELTLNNESVTITEPGTYILSGDIADGQVVVEEAGAEDKVQLVLNGVSIANSDGPAIEVRQADKVFLTLAEGTQNTLRDGAAYTLAAGEDEPNACVYSKADLTINGSGALSIQGNYNHGVYSKDDLTITGGDLTVTAVNDGLKGKDCVQILNGTFHITAGGDGIQSNNAEDAERGFVSLDGGTFTITADGDGVQAETVLQVGAGTLSIVTGGGHENGAAHSDANWGAAADAADGEQTHSAKGLKAGVSLLISGGEITVDSADDALHSNGDMTLAGGRLTLASGDDGAHADDALLLSGGAVTVTRSYEGLEGNSVTISGGTVSVVASDDGINAAGGNDGSGFGFGPSAQDSFDTRTSTYIRITGGVTTVDASGDGLDSNGTLYLEGGEVYVSGPTSNGDGALDYDGGAKVTGGVMVAVGSTGMALGFGTESTQYSFLCSLPSAVEGGAALTVSDAAGNALVSYTPVKAYQSVLVSVPALEQDGVYTVAAGGQSVEVTLTSIATNTGGGMGMGGGRGGLQPGGGRQTGGMPPDGETMPKGTSPEWGETPPDGTDAPPDLPAQ